MTPAAPLAPIPRQSLADGVFEQLRARIVRGELAVGSPVPTERELVAAFGVNRGAVREALKRLEQVGLVAMQQGGRTRVRDWRRSAGLELLPVLLEGPDGRHDPDAFRSLVEMRTALGVDAARLAAARGGAQAADALDASVARMREAGGDLERLQSLALEFWERVVDASGNVAYRLAFNSLGASYDRFRPLLRGVLAEELRDVDGCAALARAVRRGSVDAAERAARELVARGARALVSASRAAAERGGGGRRP